MYTTIVYLYVGITLYKFNACNAYSNKLLDIHYNVKWIIYHLQQEYWKDILEMKYNVMNFINKSVCRLVYA